MNSILPYIFLKHEGIEHRYRDGLEVLATTGSAKAMFVAQMTVTKCRVTSLAPEWRNRQDDLRELAAQGKIVCPGCSELIRFKSGESRRPHFAHRHKFDCPLAQQSPEVLEAKAQLYERLIVLYPTRVELDLPLKFAGFDRIADLSVRVDDSEEFYYWIFDRQQRQREDWIFARNRFNRNLHFIHLTKTLGDSTANALTLNASQRDFLCSSTFDQPYGQNHLHFYNIASRHFEVFRGIRRYHAPSLFRAEIKQSFPLTDAFPYAGDGEIIIQQDIDARREWEARIQNKSTSSPLHVENLRLKHDVQSLEPSTYQAQLYRCERCGEMTGFSDCITCSTSAKTCICRKCLPPHRTQT